MRRLRGRHVRRSSGRSKAAVGVVVVGLLALGTAGLVQQASASPAKREAASLTSAARAGAEDARRLRVSAPTTPSASPTASPRSKGRWGWSEHPRKPVRTFTATPRPTRPSASASKPVTPPPTRPSTPTATIPAAPTGTAAQQVLAQINQARAQNGLAPLQMSAPLVASARAHNRLMAGGCGLSHQCPGEADLGARISAQGVQWSAVAENIGTGGPVSGEAAAIAMAKRLTAAMLAETPPNDGHRQNILGSRYTKIGVEVYVDGSNGLWMTQDFSN